MRRGTVPGTTQPTLDDRRDLAVSVLKEYIEAAVKEGKSMFEILGSIQTAAQEAFKS